MSPHALAANSLDLATVDQIQGNFFANQVGRLSVNDLDVSYSSPGVSRRRRIRRIDALVLWLFTWQYVQRRCIDGEHHHDRDAAGPGNELTRAGRRGADHDDDDGLPDSERDDRRRG